MSKNITPFTFINAINDGQWKKVDDNYNMFLTTRFFSYFPDTIKIANEAAQFGNISKQQHFDFFFGLVSKKKRFTKWYKSDKSEIINKVCEFFELSRQKAIEVVEFLTEDQISEINEWWNEKEKL